MARSKGEGGLVYSTGKETMASLLEGITLGSEEETLSPGEQRLLLRGEMAMHFFGSQGYYAVMMETDPSLKEAVRVLGDRKSYRDLLTPKDRSDGKK